MTSALTVAGRRTVTEVAWLVRAVLRVVRFVPGAVLVWAGVGLVGAVLLGEIFVVVWVAVPLVIGVVGRWWPSWLDSQVAERVRRRRIRRHVRASWEDVRAGAGFPDGMGW